MTLSTRKLKACFVFSHPKSRMSFVYKRHYSDCCACHPNVRQTASVWCWTLTRMTLGTTVGLCSGYPCPDKVLRIIREDGKILDIDDASLALHNVALMLGVEPFDNLSTILQCLFFISLAGSSLFNLYEDSSVALLWIFGHDSDIIYADNMVGFAQRCSFVLFSQVKFASWQHRHIQTIIIYQLLN